MLGFIFLVAVISPLVAHAYFARKDRNRIGTHFASRISPRQGEIEPPFGDFAKKTSRQHMFYE